MSQFTSHLGLMLLEYANGRAVTRGDRCLWYLPQVLRYERGAEGSGAVLAVPAFDPAGWTDAELREVARRRLRVRGVTDLASIPRGFRWLLAPDGPYVKAAVLHDDGYATRGASYAPLLGRPAKRREVDDDLLEAMHVLAVPLLKRNAVYAAVRLGGWYGWGT